MASVSFKQMDRLELFAMVPHRHNYSALRARVRVHEGASGVDLLLC